MSDPVRTSVGEVDGLKPSIMELKMEPDLDQNLCRRDKLGQTVAENISSESSKLIDNLLEQVSTLNPVEKLFLYLKLPSRTQGQEMDPLRQPLNPLGSRSEITITINWIKTHLEEDPQVSLPKHEVYDEYLGYCSINSVKPLSTADFGKVMKQVYPQVRPRRLGTRGNSRYCYAGLRKRIKLDSPNTPDISTEGRAGEGRDTEEELNCAASFLIREWVEKLLAVKFDNLTELALHLLDKMYVDNRSSAAFTLLSSIHRPAGQPPSTCPPDTKLQLPSLPSLPPVGRPPSVIEPKRKLATTEPELINGKRTKSEEMRLLPPEPDLGVVYSEQQREVITSSYTRINLNPRPPSSISIDKLPRKKQALQQVCLDAEGNLLVAPLKPEEKPQIKYKEDEWADLPDDPLKSEWNNDEPADLTTHQFYVGAEKVGSGGSSSDAQEEELARYFTPGLGTENGTSSDTQSAEHKKISQLRELLQKNLKSPSGGPPLGGGAFKRTSLPIREIKDQNSVVVSSESTPTLSNRRRVSFNPLTVSDNMSTVPTSNCPVPPSPGSRRRHYSFQPISSPKSVPLQSPPASPFVSPRNTPVHMLRSRHSSGSALPVHLLPGGGGRNHHPSGCSDVSRAATYGSASESSTPFISPQGTPIPFNRSRHNSAQPRLCRSRHSSGLSLGTQYIPNTRVGFNTMPYSPGALSNLNNPFSPQPSTPCQPPETEQMYTPPNQIVQFNTGGGGIGNGNNIVLQPEDPLRSRHSSAGSAPDQAPRSAPLSPYGGPVAPAAGRVRHQSAGGAISAGATATIHYRPSWQTNGGEFTINNEDHVFHQAPYTSSQPPTPSPLEQSMQTNHNQSPLQQSMQNQTFSYQVNTVAESVPNSYRNEALGSEFGGENGELELLMQDDIEGEGDGKVRKEGGDELDLALSALRDCDTDFSKFLPPEVENPTNS